MSEEHKKFKCDLFCDESFDETHLYMVIKCGHTFHFECARKWIDVIFYNNCILIINFFSSIQAWSICPFCKKECRRRHFRRVYLSQTVGLNINEYVDKLEKPKQETSELKEKCSTLEQINNLYTRLFHLSNKKERS
uniref:RING-type domain-containing protein n=1 Tax=Parastrongyloides trichosuri TaxID=131310 RepID=A0A0N4ZL15_PARTI